MTFRNKVKRLSLEDAEVIGLKALGFLAEDEARLGRFLALTGLSVEELRQSAGSTGITSAVLEYITGDESLLLVFATSASLAPEMIPQALSVLSGPSSHGYDE